MKELKLIGNSPFEVKLIENETGLSVRKSTLNEKDGTRLFKQAEKQKAFSRFIQSDETLKHLFYVPNVYNIGHGKDFSFSMEYVRGFNILDILEYGDVTMLEGIIEKLWTLIIKEINACQVEMLAPDVFFHKLYDIMKVCPKDYLPVGYAIEKEITRSLRVPVGMCHGDMTFANMIFNDKINLIDFLDSFIESPLQDIAKIEQELDLIWTLEMRKNVSPMNRLKVSMGYTRLRKLFSKKLEEFGFKYERKIFYLLTLYRIIPYVKNKETADRIDYELRRTI